MTVVVNAVAAKTGGGAVYVRELARELAKRGARDRFILFVPPELADLRDALPSNIEWRVTSIGHAGTLRRLWWDQVTLRGILRREGAQVLYSPGNFGLLFSRVPQVLFIQNALYSSPLYRSRFLPRKSWGFRLQFFLRRWLQQLSVRQATVVMTPSRALLDELAATGFAVRPSARVNPLGTRIAPRAAVAPEPRPFRLLFPALYYEYKNLGTLLEAMKLLLQQHGLDVELLTTADPNSDLAQSAATAAADRERARDPALASRIRFIESRPPEKMAELYATCDLFVYPTLVESFGLPLIEAMACGLPVVASDIPVNRELAGDAPLYFQPLDAAELAGKVAQVARDAELRASMSRASLEQARAYTWPAHVDQLLEILEEVRG
ncbi:MAG TPA: glycosyltransferase family 1 protein [Candidatus Acidoferrales bacterium]|nr:glycosyltransferase family 1 protein [Candidatus Acidoferrales bacterium]